ncbi:glycosyltransferase [Alkalicoccus chagannorensis]|uniref:glycosyltransferase n=1 Tax=Alkalicoccus chagannorensis TaxID=427072 RepID=UPI0004249A79|nr:glycosyltransferase [Alkalicoccus chagannorensis]
MKVLYIVSTLAKTGPTNQLYNIIRSNQDKKITLMTISSEPNETLENDFKKLNIEIIQLRQGRLKGLFTLKNMIKNHLIANTYDVIHTQGIRADSIVSKLNKPNHVATARNYPWEDYPSKFGRIKGAFMARKHINTFRQTPFPVACSKALENKLSTHNIKMKVIQNGVDTSKYAPVNEKSKYKMREEFGFIKEEDIFISVGSIIPRKNMGVICEQFNRANLENTKLLIVGGGPLLENLKDKWSGNSSITFTGEVKDVREYLMISDIFVSSSYSEGLPNTVLEAISMGLPLILSDIGPHLELKTDKYTTYFSNENPNSLKHGLSDALHKYNFISNSEIHNYAKERFSSKIMSDSYFDFYNIVRESCMTNEK